MRIIWEVDDGYCGGSRPQILEIPDEEFEYCDTEEEKDNLISGRVQEDFENVVSWFITSKEDS
jgi:hypothetical protein